MSDQILDRTVEVAPNDPETRARARARAKLDFYRHVLTYVVIIGGLAVINLLTSSGYLWFLWPALGWGAALFMHAVNVFVLWDKVLDRMTERELGHSGRHAGSEHGGGAAGHP